MPRFFVPDTGFSENVVTITGSDAHHISFALRMAVGEEITVCDMRGGVHRCLLRALDGEKVLAEVIETVTESTESPLKIHLFQAYPKADKLEFIVQKAVELGVYEITPFESERVIKRPKADKIAHITERQNKIAEEAAKQCGRAVLPHVNAPVSFGEMLKRAKEYPLCLFCYEGDGTLPLGKILKEKFSGDARPDSISVVIGSEGGFSQSEAKRCADAGMIMTGLGKRILRTETASGFVLASIVCFSELF